MMKKKYKGKLGEIIPQLMLLGLMKSKPFEHVPVGVMNEVLTFENVYKSPYSISFYNKPKDWNTTDHETIRISDHWNFSSNGRFHGITVEDMPNLKWAKGIYDKELQKYKIVEIYSKETPEERKDFINSIVDRFKKFYDDGEGKQHIIYGQKFKNAINNGQVRFSSEEVPEPLVIKKWKMAQHPAKLVLINGDQELILKGKKYLINTPFKIELFGETFDGSEILENLGALKNRI